MATIGTTSRPTYVYDADTDTWIPVGMGAHTHTDIGTGAVLVAVEERWTVTASAPASTTNFDADTQGVQYYTSNTANDWTLNVRGSSSSSLTSKLAVGDSFSLSLLVTNGSTAYKPTALTIDGSAQTVKWSNGIAPAAGNASSVDAYTYTIVKTSTTPTYAVFGVGPAKYS
jgi:hypothetical protein